MIKYDFLGWLPRARFFPAGIVGSPVSKYCRMTIGKGYPGPVINVGVFAYDCDASKCLTITVADDGLKWWAGELSQMNLPDWAAAENRAWIARTAG